MKNELNAALDNVCDSVQGILTVMVPLDADAGSKVSQMKTAVNKFFAEASNSMSEEVMKIEADLDKRTKDLATKADLQTLRADLKEDISDLKGAMTTLRADLKEDISDLKGAMTTLRADLQVAMTNQVSDLRAEMQSIARSQLMWIVGGQIAVVMTFVGCMVGLMVGLDVFSK